MSVLPAEATEVRNRLLKCALEVENSRAYWRHTDGARVVDAKQTFDEYWFGARSVSRLAELLTSLRARFDAFPSALAVLHTWNDMSPATRVAICHWHVQLAEPLYRSFTGACLVERRNEADGTISRPRVVKWIETQAPGRWSLPTRIQLASKLLTVAHAAGLVATKRDPRPLLLPRIPDVALEYLMYLLRETEFEGTLLDNPYVASVGLRGGALEVRLRGLPGLAFSRQGDLTAFGWRHDNLVDWARARLDRVHARPAEVVR